MFQFYLLLSSPRLTFLVLSQLMLTFLTFVDLSKDYNIFPCATKNKVEVSQMVEQPFFLKLLYLANEKQPY